MREHETIELFNNKLCNIANQAYQLGESVDQEKLVRKTLKYLPESFRAKVLAIEEAKNLLTINLMN